MAKERKALPIETTFKLPAPLPPWPSGGGFAKGSIDLGGLEVYQLSTFTRVWATHEGGPDNLGATFLKPSNIPDGFFMLGCYCQPNNKPLFGWVLVGKGNGEDSSDAAGGTLSKPVDYTLIWSSESTKIKEDGHGYIWLPAPPQGYVAVGHIVTNSPDKPSLDEIRCVRSDLTDQCENETLIWGTNQKNNSSGINIYSSRPTTRGTQALGVCVGTFLAQVDGSSSPLACLKNKDSNRSNMPNLTQIEALMQAYSPLIYFHPDESYLPSSVTWFFNNGALLYKQGDATPTPIDPTGSNLPQGGSNDGTYWLDLPVDKQARKKTKRGELKSTVCYLHVKPMLGATFTDMAIWVFYPFNGPARAKLLLVNIPLGKIGQHVGDWEHVTLRVSNLNGELWRVYMSQHSNGRWLDAAELEFEGGNKVVSYASLNGHAMYPKPGLVLQGNSTLRIGIRNDTKKGKLSMDTGATFQVVAAEYLGSIVEPPWLGYLRKWGPTTNNTPKLLGFLPREVFGEDGPTGPKVKRSWDGDEI
ncbi:hypothetical protein At1g04090-like [Magnolia sinica]|uniref:hypothetical protein At1g04090-like n=1 Tax=Magnolia sinica TaxID=86752 RepID=UPI00265A5DBE|nr:hypothetical protein At1g04090-like [Magnolia sinica]